AARGRGGGRRAGRVGSGRPPGRRPGGGRRPIGRPGELGNSETDKEQRGHDGGSHAETPDEISTHSGSPTSHRAESDQFQPNSASLECQDLTEANVSVNTRASSGPAAPSQSPPPPPSPF